ncbi:MAG: helix-hairpin-helix domain-containing protein, partial [Planctomycetota bacterium]
SLLYQVRTETRAAQAGRAGEQAWKAAMSGVQFATHHLAKHVGEPERWTNHPGLFHRRFVHEDDEDRWVFSVYVPDRSEKAKSSEEIAFAVEERDDGVPRGVRFGVIDESSRLNVNVLDAGQLNRVPGVRPEQADAIRDWIDHDQNRHPNGAEDSDYEAAKIPYRNRNNHLRTLDDLLLVKGVDAGDIYGEDANGNGRLDPWEDDGDESFPPDDRDGELRIGLDSYLSVWPVFWAVDSRWRPQVQLNRDVDRLAELPFREETLKFIAAVRKERTKKDKNAISFHHPVDLLNARFKFRDPSGKEVEISSQVGAREIGEILDRCREHGHGHFHARRVNVNTASERLLGRLPDIDEELAAKIVRRRKEIPAEERRSIVWLLEKGLVDSNRFKRVARWLCSRGFQYRFRVVGYGERSGVFRVLEAVVDFARHRPRLLFVRDLSHLGLPFSMKAPEPTT